MRKLILYWNELSLDDKLLAGQLSAGELSARAKRAFEAVNSALHLHSTSCVSLSKGTFHADIGGRPLISLIEEWLGKDRARRLKGRSIQPADLPHYGEGLVCEVRLGSSYGDGMTRAHLTDTWVWSLGAVETSSLAQVIPAKAHELHDDNSESSNDIEVRNLADPNHTEQWKQAILEWGTKPSNSCVVGTVGSFRVLMYPLDHGYPHVHVEDLDGKLKAGKYRVDVFQPMTDTSRGMDAAVEPWVLQHAGALLQSWARCSRGLHPLRI